MESDAAIDYLKVESDTTELMNELDTNDQILEELENMLVVFKESLSGIKQEMTVLQDKSKAMNTSLANKKALSSNFENFIKNVVLEPQLIDDILDQPVNEKYVEFIDKLCQKLNFITKYNLGATLAVREIEPELSKLKLKASERLKEFMVEKINELKKPKTNIEVLQKNVLMNYKVFLTFLRDHYQTVFIELCNHYSDTLSRIYHQYLRDYFSSLAKLAHEQHSKSDAIISENTQLMRDLGKPVGGTIYTLGTRDSVLNDLEEVSVVASVIQKKNQRLPLEVLFKSVNKLLCDVVAIEFSFSMGFFSLNADQARVIFGGIFKMTLMYIIEQFKSLFNNSFDANGLLLIAILNDRNKKQFNSKGFTILDQYFDQINMLIWPRFEALYEFHVSSLKSINPKLLKPVEKSVGFKALWARYIDFSLTLYRLYSYAGESHMLKYRIIALKSVVVELLKKLSREETSEMDSTIYMITTLDMIISAYTEAKTVFEEDIVYYEKEQKIHVDSVVELLMRDFFHNLFEFVQNNTSAEELKEIMSSGDDVGSGGFNYDANSSKATGGSVNLKLIENINQELNENWARKIEKLKTECGHKFGVTSKAYKKIVVSFLKNFFTFYKLFFNFVKANHSGYLPNMIALHTYMNTIKNEIKKVDS